MNMNTDKAMPMIAIVSATHFAPSTVRLDVSVDT
jgi:hypothetical protein